LNLNIFEIKDLPGIFQVSAVSPFTACLLLRLCQASDADGQDLQDLQYIGKMSYVTQRLQHTVTVTTIFNQPQNMFASQSVRQDWFTLTTLSHDAGSLAKSVERVERHPKQTQLTHDRHLKLKSQASIIFHIFLCLRFDTGSSAGISELYALCAILCRVSTSQPTYFSRQDLWVSSEKFSPSVSDTWLLGGERSAFGHVRSSFVSDILDFGGCKML